MKKKLLLLTAIVSISLSFLFLPVTEYLETFVAWANNNPILASVIYLLIYIAVCVFLLPGSIITLAAGFVFGIVHGTILVSISSTIGATLAFIIGRTVARDYVGRMVEKQPKFSAIDSAIKDKGFLIVLLTRLSPLFPFNFLNYAYGLTAVSLRNYIIASWIGMIPGTILFVYIGSISKDISAIIQGNIDSGLAGQIMFAAGLVATIIVTAVVTRISRKILNEHISPDTKTETAGDPDIAKENTSLNETV